MMIEIIWDNKFKRSYKKKIQPNENLKSKFVSTIKLFEVDPFNPKLRTHKLTGQLKNAWAFSIDFDCRVIFEFVEPDKVLFIEIGSHEEVY
jgi:addiction module RelE/StbE family toxin